MSRPLIVLTNDDGIHSPGLAASAEALDPLGDLLIVAPREQQSGMGRSMPHHTKGRIYEKPVQIGDRHWHGYAADASPAQCVQHAIHELAERTPALVVSGINFGENVGMGVTISGTVGAALEAAAHDIPAMAVSMQVDMALHVDFDDSVDFSTAITMTRQFATRLLNVRTPSDVDVLKIDIPEGATPDTPWHITRLERKPYYVPAPIEGRDLKEEGRIGYRMAASLETSGDDTDVAALLAGHISVTPLSLDLTSRVDPAHLESLLD